MSGAKWSFPNEFPMKILENTSDPKEVGRTVGRWILTFFEKPNFETFRKIKLPLFVATDNIEDSLSIYEEPIDLEGKNRIMLNELYEVSGARPNDVEDLNQRDELDKVIVTHKVIPVGPKVIPADDGSFFNEITFPGILDHEPASLPSARVLFRLGHVPLVSGMSPEA